MDKTNKTSISIKSTLNIENPTTLELIASQLQSQCGHVLCVVNGRDLIWFNNRQAVPDNIILLSTRPIGTTTEYKFKQIGDNIEYCVYGKKAALLFYPALETFQSTIEPAPIITNIIDLPLTASDYVRPKKSTVCIIDNQESISFHTPISPACIRTYK